MSNGLRRYLYLTAATTGAVIMIVEILGAKMLSPYVGMSHFVWTAQIAVTLVALACGYYAGGRLADRTQRLSPLYWAILGAAGYLVLTVLICEPVAYWCLDFNLAFGSLLASTILFFVPLALLAMTAPFLVRVLTSSVAGVGGNVGRLTAVSTLGSFAGTMAIGYLMIPLMPNSFAMYTAAVVLVLACAGYFGFFARRYGPPLLGLLLLAVAGVASLYQSRPREYRNVVELFRRNSHFGELQVVDLRDGYCRFYLDDDLIQNTYDPKLRQSESTFTYMLSYMAAAYNTNINDALCIGLGIGVVPMDFARRGARVDVVEINPPVEEVARRFFNLQPDKLHITFDDARHYLNRCHKKYDAVVLDAFLGDSSPSHLFTREAFASMARVLRPGGVLVINCFAELDEGRDFFATSLNKTLKTVFPGVVARTSGTGAMFFMATDHPHPMVLRQPDFESVHIEARRDTSIAFDSIVEISTAHGRVLTDDYNPVEFYDARNREEIRRRLAMRARDM